MCVFFYCFNCKGKKTQIKLVKPKSKIIAEKEGLLALVSEKFIVHWFQVLDIGLKHQHVLKRRLRSISPLYFMLGSILKFHVMPNGYNKIHSVYSIPLMSEGQRASFFALLANFLLYLIGPVMLSNQEKVLTRLELHPVHKKVAGLIPGQEAINQSFSFTWMLLLPSSL